MEKTECVLGYENRNLAMSDDKCRFMTEMMAKQCEMQMNALLYNLRPDVIEKQRRDSEFVQNCPNAEWERDMGFSVPVCSMDGQYCNRQCCRQ